jgi:hypothetical protein
VKVPSGSRCLVGWDDGDPALPYVDSWEQGVGVEQIAVDGGTAGALGIGAMVRIVLPFTPTPAPGPPVPFPLFGFVEGPGNRVLKV